MKPMNVCSALVMLVMMLCSGLSAATKPTEVLKPYLDSHTCFVVEIDLTRTKPEDVSKWVETVLGGSKVENAALAQRSLTKDLLPQAQKTVNDLRKVGAKHLYWVASLADMRSDPFFMVIPIEGNVNEEKLIALLPEAGGDGREKIGNAIVAGPSGTLARLQNIEPADQPELATAFESIGDAPIRAAICVTAEVRTIMQKAPIPQFATLFDNLTWIAGALQLPPRPALKVIGQGQDADAATKAADAANELLAILKDNPELEKMEALVAQLEDVKPKAEGDRVVLSFDEPKFKKFSEALAPAIVMARMQAMRVKSASNERQIIQAMMMHASDNQGAWPDKIDTVSKKYLEGNKDVLINPAATGDDDGYIYIKPSEDNNATPAERIVIYESFDTFPAEGINVGYADGHVELLADKDKFEEQLKEAKDKSAAK